MFYLIFVLLLSEKTFLADRLEKVGVKIGFTEMSRNSVETEVSWSSRNTEGEYKVLEWVLAGPEEVGLTVSCQYTTKV